MTNAQLSAVTHHKGSCLVLAGPGSGKTKVITHRVAHLISNYHIPAEHILTITFTKSAAKEMEARFLSIMLNEHPWFGTFHSCFYHILKNSYSYFPNTFITQRHKHLILQKIISKTFQEQNLFQTLDIERVLGLYINSMLNPNCLQKYADITHEHLQKLYFEYLSALKNENLLDFDVLLMQTYELLKEHPEIRSKWQKQFQYILIDECQDMNCLQYEIIKFLAGPENNLFMVGDDDQSIYGFRGSDISVMNRFLNEFEPVKQITLDVNFRSTRLIVDSAHKVIRQNVNRFEKKTQTFNRAETGVVIKNFVYRKEMFQYVSECLLNAPKGDLNDIAIICRTNAELANWGHILRQNNIAYTAKEENKSIFSQDWYMNIETYLNLNMGNKDIVPLKNMRPYLALKYIWNTVGFDKRLKHNLSKTPERFQEIQEQFQYILEESKKFHSITDWMSHTNEDREKFELDVNVRKSNKGSGVNLITMHASKGLEFDTVFIPDVNKGKIPRGAMFTKEELEEERRLFYVAMTRAKKNLEILYIKGTEDHKLQPSVFLEPLL